MDQMPNQETCPKFNMTLYLTLPKLKKYMKKVFIFNNKIVCPKLRNLPKI